MKKVLRLLLILVLVGLVAVQFYRPKRNTSDMHPGSTFEKYPISASLDATLKTACNDCHTNNTKYPWYANVQPVGLWLEEHINDGKRHLNFSEFTTRKIAYQNHKLEEIIEMVKEGEMPLESYTWVHKDAILSDIQKKELLQWASDAMDTLKAHYPADSLVMKRRS